MPNPAADIRLYKNRASYNLGAALDIFAQGPIAHVAFLHPGDRSGEREDTLMNLPLIIAILQEDEDGDEENVESFAVYLHSHKHSGLVEAVQRGCKTLTATTTRIDGMILSPTAHDHTLNYRSATLHLCSPTILSDSDSDASTSSSLNLPFDGAHAEKTAALAAVTNTVLGYDRLAQVGQPVEANVRRTAVIKCRIRNFSCKQRLGAFNGGQEPVLEPPIGSRSSAGKEGDRAFQGVVPCWTQWGTPLGFGKDREEVEGVFGEKSARGKEFAEKAAWANEDASIEGLGKKRVV